MGAARLTWPEARSSAPARRDEVVRRSIEVLEIAFASYHPRDFAVRFWEGTVWPAEVAEPHFTLVMKRPSALRRMVATSSDLGVGEAFIYGDFDVEGDLEAVFAAVDHVADREWSAFEKASIVAKGVGLPAPESHAGRSALRARLAGRRHSRERDRSAVSYHYDVSNRFYSMWLDSRMVYSCGYFRTPGDDLDGAQVNKLDLICRKLRLAPGERFLDIGCGWGALVMHAAGAYGTEAVGITLSERQAELATERIERAGLAGLCRVELLDYRDAASLGPFDKIASVGMFEHVGEDLLPAYFGAAFEALRPGGLFLNHGISRPVSGSYGQPLDARPGSWGPYPLAGRFRSAGPSFSDVYVFPDSELVPVSTALTHAERAGFEVRDTESLREHYARTLREWVARLEAARADAVAEVGEERYRVWRLFMTASACGFASGNLGVYQALMSKPDHGASGLPPTRADLYR